jgi:hypothetical protein
MVFARSRVPRRAPHRRRIRCFGQEARQPVELRELAGITRLGSQPPRRVLEHGVHPVPGEGLLGRFEHGLRLRFASPLEVQMRLARAALARRGARPGIAEESPQRRQQVVAETAKRWIGSLVPVALEKPCEEFLGQVLGVRGGVAGASHEGKNRAR